MFMSMTNFIGHCIPVPLPMRQSIGLDLSKGNSRDGRGAYQPFSLRLAGWDATYGKPHSVTQMLTDRTPGVIAISNRQLGLTVTSNSPPRRRYDSDQPRRAIGILLACFSEITSFSSIEESLCGDWGVSAHINRKYRQTGTVKHWLALVGLTPDLLGDDLSSRFNWVRSIDPLLSNRLADSRFDNVPKVRRVLGLQVSIIRV